jgi:alpha-L-fucosidase
MEYEVHPKAQHRPWECVRGMDKSFGYNRTSEEEDFLSRADLLGCLDDVVAKNGNLLINVGPRGEDGVIPAPQMARLRWLGEHMRARAD